MSTTSTTVSTTGLRRAVAAAAATCALVTLAACGAEVAPPKNDIGGAGPQEPAVTATLEDCLDTSKQPPVTSCPYPVKSGDGVADTLHHLEYDDEYGRPGR